jgi:hypothetical protein
MWTLVGVAGAATNATGCDAFLFLLCPPLLYLVTCVLVMLYESAIGLFWATA